MRKHFDKDTDNYKCYLPCLDGVSRTLGMEPVYDYLKGMAYYNHVLLKDPLDSKDYIQIGRIFYLVCPDVFLLTTE